VCCVLFVVLCVSAMCGVTPFSHGGDKRGQGLAPKHVAEAMITFK
jgi:hypothetical protein